MTKPQRSQSKSDVVITSITSLLYRVNLVDLATILKEKKINYRANISHSGEFKEVTTSILLKVVLSDKVNNTCGYLKIGVTSKSTYTLGKHVFCFAY